MIGCRRRYTKKKPAMRSTNDEDENKHGSFCLKTYHLGSLSSISLNLNQGHNCQLILKLGW